MKRLITFVTAMVITAASVISAHAAEIPFESAPKMQQQSRFILCRTL